MCIFDFQSEKFGGGADPFGLPNLSFVHFLTYLCADGNKKVDIYSLTQSIRYKIIAFEQQILFDNKRRWCVQKIYFYLHFFAEFKKNSSGNIKSFQLHIPNFHFQSICKK